MHKPKRCSCRLICELNRTGLWSQCHSAWAGCGIVAKHYKTNIRLNNWHEFLFHAMVLKDWVLKGCSTVIRSPSVLSFNFQDPLMSQMAAASGYRMSVSEEDKGRCTLPGLQSSSEEIQQNNSDFLVLLATAD